MVIGGMFVDKRAVGVEAVRRSDGKSHPGYTEYDAEGCAVYCGGCDLVLGGCCV